MTLVDFIKKDLDEQRPWQTKRSEDDTLSGGGRQQFQTPKHNKYAEHYQPYTTGI